MTAHDGYLCPRCQAGTLEDWLLGVTRRATEVGSLSTALWGMRECAAGHPFTELFGDSGPRNTAPYMLERVTMEAAYIAQSFEKLDSGDIIPIQLDTAPPLKRSGMFLDALTWLGLAVASGVLGNVAYDGIKAVVIRFRERAEPDPPQDLTEEELERYLAVMHEYLTRRLADVRVLDDDEG